MGVNKEKVPESVKREWKSFSPLNNDVYKPRFSSSKQNIGYTVMAVVAILAMLALLLIPVLVKP